MYREQLQVATIKQSDDYNKLDDKTREIFNLIINQEDVFKGSTQTQTAEIKAMHTETNETVIDQHNVTRIEIIEAIQIKGKVVRLLSKQPNKKFLSSKWLYSS